LRKIFIKGEKHCFCLFAEHKKNISKKRKIIQKTSNISKGRKQDDKKGTIGFQEELIKTTLCL